MTPLHPTQLRKRWPTPLVHLIAHRADGPYVACAYGLDGDTATDDAAELTCEHCKWIARMASDWTPETVAQFNAADGEELRQIAATATEETR